MSKAFKNGFKKGVGYALGMHVGSLIFLAAAKIILNATNENNIENKNI